MAITKLVLNGTEYEIGSSSSSSTATDIARYDGVELEDYDWSDFQSMCDTGDFEDIQVGDYKTIELTTGETVVMQIAGIDTYRQYDSSLINHHIDWISRDLLENGSSWKANNNGDSANPEPYLASTMYEYLNGEVYESLPSEIQNVITNKFLTLETRYSSGDDLLTESSGDSNWVDIGPVWIPSEYEVFGSTSFGTPGYSSSGAVQYPLFANSTYHRTKHITPEDLQGLAYWYTLTAGADSSYTAVSVNSYGFPTLYGSMMGLYVPLCFRIAA